MTRTPRYHAIHSGAARPNILAALITCSAIGVLVLNFQLQPARAVSRHNQGLPTVTQLAPSLPVQPSQNNSNQDSTDNAATGEKNAANQTVGGSACRGRLALFLNVALLEEGIRWLEKQPNYTATFHKDEYLPEKEEVTGNQTIEFKARHEPFSVYMKWLNGDAGRELIYSDGQNGNKMIVHAGQGLKSMLTLNLAPESSIAMSEARHPVTQSGLLNLAKTMVKYRKRDLAAGDKVNCCMGPDQLFDNRPCYSFTIEFGSEEIDPDYRKTIVLFDREWSIPVWVKNFGWLDTEGDEELAQCTPEELDEYSFLEFYAFSNIRFEQSLQDRDFDRENEDYKF